MICIDTMIIIIIDIWYIYNIGIITRVILIAIACIILAVIYWIIITILSGLLLSMILVYSLCRTNIQHIWYVIYGRVWKWGIPPK